jgi:hypothetical protein
MHSRRTLDQKPSLQAVCVGRAIRAASTKFRCHGGTYVPRNLRTGAAPIAVRGV